MTVKRVRVGAGTTLRLYWIMSGRLIRCPEGNNKLTAQLATELTVGVPQPYPFEEGMREAAPILGISGLEGRLICLDEAPGIRAQLAAEQLPAELPWGKGLIFP